MRVLLPEHTSRGRRDERPLRSWAEPRALQDLRMSEAQEAMQCPSPLPSVCGRCPSGALAMPDCSLPRQARKCMQVAADIRDSAQTMREKFRLLPCSPSLRPGELVNSLLAWLGCKSEGQKFGEPQGRSCAGTARLVLPNRRPQLSLAALPPLPEGCFPGGLWFRPRTEMRRGEGTGNRPRSFARPQAPGAVQRAREPKGKSGSACVGSVSAIHGIFTERQELCEDCELVAPES